jgi:hypothetical protein
MCLKAPHWSNMAESWTMRLHTKITSYVEPQKKKILSERPVKVLHVTSDTS